MREFICEEAPMTKIDGTVVGVAMVKRKELVRCKDCKFAERDGWDRRICQNVGHPVKDDFFCADGERI